MKTYLSIDLDYWSDHRTSYSIEKFFGKVFRLNLPLYVCIHHHHLLKDINTKSLDTLINVDYHSDIVNYFPDIEEKLKLNEGTWGNFLKFKKYGTFIWRYPQNPNWGYCHVPRTGDCNPFINPLVAGWNKVVSNKGLRNIPWTTIKAIGVCLSPGWLGKYDVVEPILCKLKLNSYYYKWSEGICVDKVEPYEIKV